jgi:hypothetical protein
MKIAFVPYYEIQEIFYINDFNWNVTSSNSGTKEFRLIYEKLETLLTTSSVATPSDKLQSPINSPLIEGWTRSGRGEHFPSTEGNLSGVVETAPTKLFIFHFEKDEAELQTFIKENFVRGKSGTTKIQITKNNFISVYHKWLSEVKPSIQLNFTWDEARNQGYIDADFYLADLMSFENKTLGEKLFVLLKENYYKFDKEVRIDGRITYSEVHFKDNQKTHNLFWNRYERPPREEYREFILERRDLLVPQDIRERKGSFYTPQIWVELSQKYIADVFGESWQEEYYIWDCAAGTGNLLVGLTEKYRIYASTLDKADVSVMHERIEKGANLLKDHVFQFDFLNDDFSKLPASLQKIIKNTPEKLIIYINPPYAESSIYGFESKKGVSLSKIYDQHNKQIGTGVRELFIQFMLRVKFEIRKSKLCIFSKLKYITSINFTKYRDFFKGDFKKGFVVPADTFDNVSGKFPIGFIIWDLSTQERIKSVELDVFSHYGQYLSKKSVFVNEANISVIDWLRQFYDKKGERLAYLRMLGTDMQTNKQIFITNKLSDNDIKKILFTIITKNNLLEMCIYNTIRHIFDNTWLNDRDQFLYPNGGWKDDTIFQTDCLTYTLFHNSNNISSQHGTNHWIPFTESEVNAHTRFDSNFMTDFIAGKINRSGHISNRQMVMDFDEDCPPVVPISDWQDNVADWKSALPFSPQAQAVFNAGRELWKYYHSQNTPSASDHPSMRVEYNVNASYYDIREHFQGREREPHGQKGRMKSTSDDERYTTLLSDLRHAMRVLAKQIEPKIYEYGFLKE